jgi:hypothetical protein
MHVAGHHQNGHLFATELKRAKGFLCFDGTFKSSYGWFGYAKIDQNRFSFQWETTGASKF